MLYFTGVDLFIRSADVFSNISSDSVIPDELYQKTKDIVMKLIEFDGNLTDEVVTSMLCSHPTFPGGMSEFKRALVLCHAKHIVNHRDPDDLPESLREVFQFYIHKSLRFHPQVPVPKIPEDGGELIMFLNNFNVKQLLTIGW